ncbi:MAG: glycogen/starch/alpha-glucan family phosphorylase [Oscillospiraceae bacterium]|jgi:starch phosphorylase|nr:glycogen/starch/alpha-glucan family phosphorylase [Oscillospiraceae bacterium]
MNQFHEDIVKNLERTGIPDPAGASPEQLHAAIAQATLRCLPEWISQNGKRACYLSMEFLPGRLAHSNLLNLGLLDDMAAYLREKGRDIAELDEIPDAALGNGGLGRLAACFLDSAATQGLPLDGFGIRFRYGLFAQTFEDGFQREQPDDWLCAGDPWSVRREEESILVRMRGQTVRAVPYDMPVIGYGGKTVNILRLWEAETEDGLGFETVQTGHDDDGAVINAATDICAVLYPNDQTDEGRRLRLKQEYFLASATVQTLLNRYTAVHGDDISGFADSFALQLNDTHPVLAIPELLRLLIADYALSPEESLSLVRKACAYTNHTVMPEALETWDTELFIGLLPEVYPYVVLLQNALTRDLKRAQALTLRDSLAIVKQGRIHMANMAVFGGHSVNGVAELHTQILKDSLLKDWYTLYPERFQNKTNGITQRRWLRLCNPELSALITERIGERWVTDLDELKKLETYKDDGDTLRLLCEVKRAKKEQLCEVLRLREGFELSPDMMFDIQIKRIHEYKRQLLNALSILDSYWRIKEGSVTDPTPTAYLFGGKSAPGYARAKAIIKFINEVAQMVNEDPAVRDVLRVVFVQDYNVSYAEKLIPAADISEQISPAGTEASGTGNMKLMLNGAVTLGTLDGANVEIVRAAGAENNYIFGLTAAQADALRTGTYHARELYDSDPRLKRAVDALTDGTVRGGREGLYRELYSSLLDGTDWHKPDHYFLLKDFDSYTQTKSQAGRDYRDGLAFARKQLMNIANAGRFSSDRTVREYASGIWRV